MQAVVFTAPNNAEFQRTAEPQLPPGHLRLGIRRAGICGTDLHIYKGEYLSAFPLIPGHECVAEVLELSADAQSDLQPGDRVAVDPNLSCNACHYCRRQMNNHCLNWQALGVTLPGAFAQQMVAPAAICYRLPDAIDDMAGALIEPVSCAVHALSRLPINPGDHALIMGAGPMGLILTQLLSGSPLASLTVTDRQSDRIALADELGADHTRMADENLAGALADLAPRGFDIIVDATGVPAAIESAFSHLAPRGRFLQFGVTTDAVEIPVKPFDIFKNEWQIIGSFALCYSFEQTIALMAAGRIQTAPLVSHTVGLDEFQAVFDDFAAGKTRKVHLVP